MHDIAPEEKLLASTLDHVATMTGRMTRQRHHRDAGSHLTAGDRARPPTVWSSGLLGPFRNHPLLFAFDLRRNAV